MDDAGIVNFAAQKDAVELRPVSEPGEAGDGVDLGDVGDLGEVDLQAAPLDTDGDGLPDFRDLDSDADGVLDALDNCRLVDNADQADEDTDGVGDACTPLDADLAPGAPGGVPAEDTR